MRILLLVAREMFGTFPASDQHWHCSVSLCLFGAVEFCKDFVQRTRRAAFLFRLIFALWVSTREVEGSEEGVVEE